MLIRNLKELATNHMGEAPKIAVVGVPHHFTEKQTEAFQSAVALSGIKVGQTALSLDAIMHESHYQIALIMQLDLVCKRVRPVSHTKFMCTVT
jgi:hypothetical protein